jgi:hypothetical protein
MKRKFNVGILLAAIGFSLGMSSCKKEWSCECNGQTVSLAYLGKIKKKDAKKVCEAAGCTLK